MQDQIQDLNKGGGGYIFLVYLGLIINQIKGLFKEYHKNWGPRSPPWIRPYVNDVGVV